MKSLKQMKEEIATLKAKIASTDKIVEGKLKAKYGHLFIESDWAVLCNQCDGGGCARCDETGHGFYASIEDL